MRRRLERTQAFVATGAETRTAKSVVMKAAMVFILTLFFGHFPFRFR